MAKKYSAEERKAYHMGRSYAAAKAGKRVKCPDKKTEQSFRNGVKAARENLNNSKKSAQSKCANCGAPLYVVDGDGVVLQVLGGAK